MVKLKVSYENTSELNELVDKLGNNIESVKIPNKQEGKYKKVYIILKDCKINDFMV